MIDLHIHSKYSDGTYFVKEILEEAERKNIEIISITDHDTVEAYKELKNIDIQKFYSGKIITGCEFKCLYEKYKLPIEILGYGFNIKEVDSELNSNKNEIIQNRYLEKLKDIGNRIGLEFDKKLEINYENDSYASAVFEREINSYPNNKKILEYNHISIKENFYREAQSNPNSIFYIDETKDYLNANIIIDLIHKAGGMAFLAHPFVYPIDNTLEKLEEFVNEYNIDGIECYYSLFTNNQISQLEKICKKHHLYMSGGTDFHGEKKPDIDLGIGKGNLKISKEKISNWINKINNMQINI